MDTDFPRVNKLPPYVFDEIQSLKMKARRNGKDIVDLGMGNPDGATPEPIVEKPKATMFVWAKIPDSMIRLGSLEFSKQLLTEAKVAVSPGVGFGEYGEGFVRFSLIENEHRTKQAIRNIKKFISSKEKIHVIGQKS